MVERIIKNITFFSKDTTSYNCNLVRDVETTEDVEQFNKDITELRKRHFQLLRSQKGYNYRTKHYVQAFLRKASKLSPIIR